MGDVWTMAGAHQMPIYSPKFKTVEASGLTWISGANAKPSNTSWNTTQGQLEETESECTSYVMRLLLSNDQVEDLSGIVQYLTQTIMRLWGKQRGALTTKAMAAGSTQNIASGGTNTALTDSKYLLEDNGIDR